ncbi:MAG: SPOR domain-containing protein [Bacteroidales bacterium]|nr:SPOR domain-containing protein [Bacteroidales bacterium]
MRVKGTVVLAFLSAALIVSGCDFMRKVAGRPTSADLQAMVAAREQEEARAARALQERQQREKELQYQADSLLAVQTMEGIVMNRLSDLNVRVTTELPAKYNVVLGAFSDASNADNLISRLKEAGYEASAMRYRSGKTAVLACCTDSFVELGKSFASLQKENYCPKDVWVIVKE